MYGLNHYGISRYASFQLQIEEETKMSSLLVVPGRLDSDVTGASLRRAQPWYPGPLFLPK